jgi:hypothetical protein
VLRIIDAIACARFRVRVRVARADQAGRDDAR